MRKKQVEPVRLSSEEAMRLINQPGVVANAPADASFLQDGDVLLAFDLPDGRTVEYFADFESEYYGGEYKHAYWQIIPSPLSEGKEP